ncbi:MFS transporter [Streptomyces sp. NBS 14/10]|uniref:MFS transporter n=1 Tax=Streptomyces sp. NBS 14/10 TaxID=1945643 RepID=UPI000B7E2835|nr:MFS transporter [Streptomyces sp. NBS 14/10]KAK1176945.1 MFS transporter [Streptomyces sp. NBS 14/10]
MTSAAPRAPLPGYGTFLTGWGATTFGSGLMLPITVTYLREVLRLPLSGVSLYFALYALSGLVVNPLAIRIGRAHGPGTSVAAAAVLQASGWGLFTMADSMPLVMVAAALSGAGTGMYYAVQTPLLTRVFGDGALSRVLSGQNRTTALTMTVGTLLGGQAVHRFGAEGYTACLTANALSYLVHGAILVSLVRSYGGVPAIRPQDAGAPRRARGRALRDPVFLCLLVFQFSLVVFGLGQFDSVVPAILGNAQLSVTAISVVMACNTGGVIVLQGLALRVVERIDYVGALVAAIASWTAALAMLGCALLTSGTLPKVVLGAVFGVLFAVGECLIAPSVQPLVTTTAPPDSLESYAAATSLAHGLGAFLAPLVLLPVVELAGTGAYFVLQLGGFGLALYALLSFRRRTARRRETTPASL